jgi:SAM-dependent methyltransferase
MVRQKVKFWSDPAHYLEKEQLYLEVRRKEGRVLDDVAVRQLPDVPLNHLNYKEWLWRKRSLARFQRHVFAKFGPSVQLLDLGCGNGWMANRLAENPTWYITAMDVNQHELEQGARIFGRTNLEFIYADVATWNYSNEEASLMASLKRRYDVVLLAASVQYFPDLQLLIPVLRHLLQDNGEIHIIDSHFYQHEAARAAARQRTVDYYETVGVPEMATFYHHHLWRDIQQLGAENLNNGLIINLLQRFRWLGPFPWIQLKKCRP